MLVGRRISTFEAEAGGLGQPIEERGLRGVVDDLSDFRVGIVLAQAFDVGIGDQRRVDRDFARDGEDHAFGLRNRFARIVECVDR